MAGAAPSLWSAVDRLVDSTDDVADLRANRLHLLAARRWRELGRPVPDELADEERRSVLSVLVLPRLLATIRDAVDGQLVLHKGPEVAARYPDPVLRPFIDLDLLVPDATEAQRALVAAGFVEVGDPAFYAKAPHRLPLELPGIPLLVEVHENLNWPRWLGTSPTAELLAASIPSSVGVDGVETLEPSHHALAVATHAWAHGPFTRVGDLVDVAALSDGLDRGELARLAERWGIGRLWRTTSSAADAVLFGAPAPRAVRTWARNLPAVRERTVLENHVGRWVSGFSALGSLGGFRVLAIELERTLRPEVGESWPQKLARIPRALRNAFVRRTAHDESAGRSRRR